jgi:hypothetical protein
MESATLGVLIQAQDNASPILQSVGQSMAEVKTKTTAMTQVGSSDVKVFTSTLSDNKSAIRELSMGTMMLGASFMAMGVALKGTNSQLGQTIGQTLMMVGSVMTAIGSTVQFISAISKTIHALQALAASEALVQALSNPLFLILGLAAGAGVVAGISALNKSESKGGASHITLENKTYLDGRQISSTVRRDIVLNQQQNSTSGIR